MGTSLTNLCSPFLHSCSSSQCKPLFACPTNTRLHSCSSSQCKLLFACPTNTRKRLVIKRKSENQDFCRRMFLGISVRPLLKGATDSQGRQKEETEQTIQRNPFLSLLNGLGIVGSFVFGSLYALTLYEKAVSDSTVQSMEKKLKDKEDAFDSMKKQFESQLWNAKEDRKKIIRREDEERDLTEELIFEINCVQDDLMGTEKSKKKLQEKLKEKVDLIKILRAQVARELKDAEASLVSSTSKIAEKESEVDTLSSEIKELLLERDESNSISKKNELSSPKAVPSCSSTWCSIVSSSPNSFASEATLSSELFLNSLYSF